MLTAHRQSGGERSVSTILYLIALQVGRSRGGEERGGESNEAIRGTKGLLGRHAGSREGWRAREGVGECGYMGVCQGGKELLGCCEG